MPVSVEVVARELKRMTLQKAASELLRYTDKTIRETLEILAEPSYYKESTTLRKYREFKNAQDFGPKPV